VRRARGSGEAEAVTRIVWLLNLDADDELAAAGRPSGPRYQPEGSAAMLRARVDACMEALGPLVGDGLLVDRAPLEATRGLPGRAFCPTPSARARLEAAGASVPPSPPLPVLVAVNHRRFSAELGQGLDGGQWVSTMDELRAAFAGPVAERAGEWVLKHPHGYVGRRRHLTSTLDARTLGFAARCLAEAGGLQLEPWVAREADYALHGYVTAAGVASFGAPTQQICDGRGVWQSTSRVTDLGAEERAGLVREAARTAEALAAAGYFGPFGVDAFRYSEAGVSRFCARCEINARYTMGWAIGFGAERPDRLV